MFCFHSIMFDILFYISGDKNVKTEDVQKGNGTVFQLAMYSHSIQVTSLTSYIGATGLDAPTLYGF